jgi:DNA-binding response OmpR family regulator
MQHDARARKHLLVVEDDEFVQQLLAACLENEGYEVSLAVSGKEMFGMLDRGRVDLVLLDLGLPDEEGLVLARQIRSRSTLPIIVLTARKEQENRLAALELGADDYLTKPCDPRELALRVRNVLARSGTGAKGGGRPTSPEVLRFDGWVIDIAGRTLTAPDGRDVRLTGAEFNLLVALVGAPNRALTRGYLLDAVSRLESEATERMIDVLVSRLRRKIEADPRKPEFIVTIVGFGYKFTGKVCR